MGGIYSQKTRMRACSRVAHASACSVGVMERGAWPLEPSCSITQTGRERVPGIASTDGRKWDALGERWIVTIVRGPKL